MDATGPSFVPRAPAVTPLRQRISTHALNLAPDEPQMLPGSACPSDRGPVERGGPGARTLSRCARSRSTATTWCAVAESRPVVTSSRKYTRCGPTSASPARPAGRPRARRGGLARPGARARTRGGGSAAGWRGPARRVQPCVSSPGCMKREQGAAGAARVSVPALPMYTQTMIESPATASRSGARGCVADAVPGWLTKRRTRAFGVRARAGALDPAALHAKTGPTGARRGRGAGARPRWSA
jgi:hypothetical protein